MMMMMMNDGTPQQQQAAISYVRQLPAVIHSGQV